MMDAPRTFPRRRYGAKFLPRCAFAPLREILFVVICLSGATAYAADDPLPSLIAAVAASEEPEIQADLLRGMRDGLRGAKALDAPEGWDSLYTKLQASGNARLRAVADDLARLFGDENVWVKTYAKLWAKGQPADERVAALQKLVEQRHPNIAGELPPLLEDPDLRLYAIRAMATIEIKDAPRLLLGRYKDFSPEEKLATVQTLASRRGHAWAIGHAIREGRVPREDVPAYVRRQIVGLIGRGSIPEIDDVPELPEDKGRLIARWKKRLGEGELAKADPANGRAVFDRTCAACHKLFDSGGAIGPELTGSNRADLDYILDNIINPSGDVADDYKLVIVSLAGGRVVAGNIIEEDDRQLVLRTVSEQTTIEKDEIEERQVSRVSLMPDGLLTHLEEKDVRDLIAYLRSPKQVASKSP